MPTLKKPSHKDLSMQNTRPFTKEAFKKGRSFWVNEQCEPSQLYNSSIPVGSTNSTRYGIINGVVKDLSTGLSKFCSWSQEDGSCIIDPSPTWNLREAPLALWGDTPIFQGDTLRFQYHASPGISTMPFVISNLSEPDIDLLIDIHIFNMSQATLDIEILPKNVRPAPTSTESNSPGETIMLTLKRPSNSELSIQTTRPFTKEAFDKKCPLWVHPYYELVENCTCLASLTSVQGTLQSRDTGLMQFVNWNINNGAPLLGTNYPLREAPLAMWGNTPIFCGDTLKFQYLTGSDVNTEFFLIPNFSDMDLSMLMTRQLLCLPRVTLNIEVLPKDGSPLPSELIQTPSLNLNNGGQGERSQKLMMNMFLKTFEDNRQDVINWMVDNYPNDVKKTLDEAIKHQSVETVQSSQ